LTDWTKRYLELAELVAGWSKDPSTKVGAVVVGEHGQILSTGYNGFPRGVRDTDDRLLDRETKYKFTIHAEMNCIYNAALSDVSLEGATMYVFGLPICHECAKGIAQAGIREVVIPAPAINTASKWEESWKVSQQIFDETGVNVMLRLEKNE
jgi:dCMP deaminase